MKDYALGFCFLDKSLDKLVLIKKKRPSWMNGFLNGIGGSVESEESPRAAMIREFKEETGVLVKNWSYFGVLTNETDGARIHLFTAINKKAVNVRQTTDEEVGIFFAKTFIRSFLESGALLPSNSYLINMAVCSLKKGIHSKFFDISIK